MNPPNIYYSSLLMAAGVICLVVAAIVWVMRRGAPGAKALTVFLLGLSWWDITYSIFWMNFRGPTPYFWLDITLVGAFTVPTAFLIFSLTQVRLQNWLTRPVVFALLIEPVFTFIVLWTDPWHGLFFGGKRALNTTMILDAGPVSWVNVYYSYFLVLVSVLILIFAFYRSVGIYRTQTGMIVAAVLVPWAVHIGFLSTGGILPNADITPFIFSITAVIIAFALINFRLLDVIPIAHSVLFENMSEGVIVLDTQDRVVNINPAALSVAGSSAAEAIGAPVAKVLSFWPNLVAQFQGGSQANIELPVGEAYLDLRISQLTDERGQLVGRLIVWRDIAELKATQAKLEQLATVDGLTGVLNRRSFMEKAGVEFERSARYGKPLSMALMDIDQFKKINDTYGHQAGDQVLIQIANLCMGNIREIDSFARFGGEEFLLLMPETTAEEAYQICERLRLLIMYTIIRVENVPISPTISLGITTRLNMQEEFEPVLRCADKALYSAKQSGRNRTEVWSGE